MATLGWANMVPAAMRAAASTPNVVFILCFLLPSLNAFYGPIANLFKMLRFPLLGASQRGGSAPRRWFSADHGHKDPHHEALHRLRLADLQIRTEFFEGGFRSDSILRAQGLLFSVLDEAVRPADAHHRRGQPQDVQLLQHGAAEPSAEDVVFERHDYLDRAREELHHLDVDRLGEAGVDDCRGDTFALQLAGDLFGHGNQRAQREDG